MLKLTGEVSGEVRTSNQVSRMMCLISRYVAIMRALLLRNSDFVENHFSGSNSFDPSFEVQVIS